jgi:hypothetical protein
LLLVPLIFICNYYYLLRLELKYNFAYHYYLDRERNIIENYFHLGYKYDLIVSLLKSEHGMEMTVRTLKRFLKSYRLSRRGDNENFDEEHIRNIIRQEMESAGGSLAGYRKMWHILRLKHHLHVPRKIVAQILRELDPEASDMRRRKRLKRRRYISQGPNQCWHIDGMLHMYYTNR